MKIIVLLLPAQFVQFLLYKSGFLKCIICDFFWSGIPDYLQVNMFE